MSVLLKFIPHEAKKCDCLEKALSKVPGVTHLVVGATEARMNYRGDWDDLCQIEYAAWRIRAKASLVEPAQCVIDFSIGRSAETKRLVEALSRVPGVLNAFIDDGQAVVIGPVAELDARKLPDVFAGAGFRYLALRSHRLRTLSYAAWDADSQIEALKGAIGGVPGVLRVDVDEAAKTISVLMMPRSARDLDLASAAAEAAFTVFPGRAKEEEGADGKSAGSSTPPE